MGKVVFFFKRNPLWAIIIFALIVFVASSAIKSYIDSVNVEKTYNIKNGEFLSEVTVDDLKKTKTIIYLDRGGVLETALKSVFIKSLNDADKINVYKNVNKDTMEGFKDVLAQAQKQGYSFKIYSTAKPDGLDEMLETKVSPPLNVLVDEVDFGQIFLNILPTIFLLLFLLYIMKSSGLKGTKIEKIEPKEIKTTFDDIVGMDEAKGELKQFADQYNNKELYKKFNVDKPLNVMLTGGAGTGKTITAKAFAKFLDIPLYYLSCSSLQTGYVGGGTRTLKELVAKAKKNKRAIIFIDEAEGILQSRENGTIRSWESETITTLLSLMDGIHKNTESEIIWFVASNMTETNFKMDPAVLRRLPLQIHYRLPDFEERKKLINLLLSKIDPEYYDKNINTKHLAHISANMSPASIETIINKACLLAIRSKTQVNEEVLLTAFERFIIGFTNRRTDNEVERLRIARHEVGHFMLSLKNALSKNPDVDQLEDNLNVIKISVEEVARFNALGFELSKQEEIRNYSREELEQKIIHCYGGMANESVYYGESKVSSGAADDIKKATTILTTMHLELGMYSAYKLNYDILDKHYQNRDEVLDSVRKKSEELYLNAQKFLERNRALSDVLVTELMRDYVLNIDQLINLIRDFHKKNGYVLVSDNCEIGS